MTTATPVSRTAAKTAAAARRRRGLAYGTWQPFVDATAAREHVRALSAAGTGWKTTARLAGVGEGAIATLLYGTSTRPPTARIRPETERAILSVQPGGASVLPGTRIDATATRRRLQALVACGYSQSALGARLGIAPTNIGALFRRDKVRAGTARAVQELYDWLWDIPPDESAKGARQSVTAARNYAAAHGWPPPAAWDDSTIGDPEAGPADGWQRRAYLTPAELAEEVAELLRQEYSRADAAERLGVSVRTLERALRLTRESQGRAA